MDEELKACPLPFCGGPVQFHKDDDCAGCHLIECQSCKTTFDLATKADPYNQADSIEGLQRGIAYLWNLPAPAASQGGEASAEGDRPGYDALWLWFSLSRSSYAVLPRVMMHDMPDAWQAAFARLMDEWDETWIKQPNIGARVQITDSDGKLIGTPGWLLNYRHPDRDQLDRMRATHSPQ